MKNSLRIPTTVLQTFLTICLVFLACTMSTQAGTNVTASWLIWQEIPDCGGSGWPVFVTGSTTVVRTSAVERVAIANKPNEVDGVFADDRVDMRVNGGSWITLTRFESPPYAHCDITQYVPVGTNTLEFQGVDESPVPDYCATALYVVKGRSVQEEQRNPQTPLSDSKEPVNTINGAMHFQETDLVIPCPGIPLVFERTYLSSQDRETSLGTGWNHNYEWNLGQTNVILESTTNTWKVLTTGDGREYRFLQLSNDTYQSPFDNNWRLDFTNNGYRVTFPGGTVYTFDTNGVLQGIADLWNNTLTLSYTNGPATNLLSRIQHSNGQYLDVLWQSNRLSDVRTPFTNVSLSFRYTGSGQLTNSVLSASNQSCSITYAYSTWLTQKVDAVGTVFAYAYTNDGSGRCVSIQVNTNYYNHTVDMDEPGEVLLRYERNETNQLYAYSYQRSMSRLNTIGIHEGWGWTDITNSFEYDIEGNIATNSLRELNYSTGLFYRMIRRCRYDANHNITNMSVGGTYGGTNIWQFSWDTNINLCTSIIDPEGGKSETEYTNALPLRQKLFWNTSNSYDTTYAYTTNGLLSAITNANGHWMRFLYNQYGFPTSTIPQIGPTNSFEYSALGYLTRMRLPSMNTDSNGTMVTRDIMFNVDGFGRPTNITYLTTNSLTETLAYSAVGDLTNHVDTGGRRTSYTWLPTGKLSSMSRQFGTSNLTTSFSYDQQFNLTAIRDAKNRNVEIRTYDLADRTHFVTNLEGQCMHFIYAVDNLPKQITKFDGTWMNFEYDSEMRVSSVAYVNSTSAPYTYTTNTFTYCRNDLLKTASNPTCTISNEFNFANRLASSSIQVSGFTSQVSYNYLPAGNLSNMVSVAGTNTWTYDEAERVTSITATRKGLSPLQFNVSYDPWNGLPYEITCTNTGMKVTYDRNDLDRVVWIGWRDSSNNTLKSFGYTYNSAGTVAGLTGPGFSEDISYTYDDLDRLTGETRRNSQGATIFSETISYDEVGNRTSKTRDGVSVVYSYSNGCNRLSGWAVTQTNLYAQMDVFGVANENVSSTSHWGQLWVSNSYGVLTPSASGSNFWVTDMSFTLGTQSVVAAIRDDAGNTTLTTNQVFLSIITNASYSHSAAGCITNILYTGQSYSKNVELTWNSQYQLTAVSTNGVEGERNGYDAMGRRVWNWDGTTTNFFVWSGADLIAEVDSTGGLRRSYVYAGLDMPLAMTVYTGATPVTYFYLTDKMGTVHAIANETGTVVESYRFDAWGRVLGVYDSNNQPLSESAIGNRFLWQGKQYSFRTGFYQNRHRVYDPITGRFLSKDPLRISGGLNEFTYTENNPVNFRDWSGLCTDEGYDWNRVSNFVETYQFSNVYDWLLIGNSVANTPFRYWRAGLGKATGSPSTWGSFLGNRYPIKMPFRLMNTSNLFRAAGRVTVVLTVLEGFYDIGILGQGLVEGVPPVTRERICGLAVENPGF